MKKIMIIFSACLLLSTNAFAIFGMGDIVADPTSYTYYVQQIKQATKQYEELKKQLETAEEMLDETVDMKNQLVGAYDHATGMVEKIKMIQDNIKNDPTAMLKYAEKFLKFEDGEYVDPRELINGIFKDPRAKRDQIEKFKDLNKKYHARQKNLEETIVQAEKTLNAMPEKYKLIEELAGKIDSTQNVKSAMDLNNRILAEILKVLTDHLMLTAHIGEAQTIINFEGVDDTQTDQIEKDLKYNQEKSKNHRVMGKFLDKQGIDTSNVSNDELYKILNKKR